MSVRMGWAEKRSCHSSGFSSHMETSALRKEKGSFSAAVLEVDAGVAGFDIGESVLPAGDWAAGGRLLRARGLQEHGGEVPLAVGARSRLRLGSSSEMRAISSRPRQSESDAEGGGDTGALKDRLRAVAGGRVHDEVGDLDSGAGQQMQRDAGDFYRMAEAGGEEAAIWRW